MEIKSKVVANKRLLVANRGEIATRIFRAATELNIHTVGMYSWEDRFSVHRFKADEAYKVGIPGDPLGSYLNWQNIIALALERDVDAIHPGYGFLSENAEFAAACEEKDIMFCGPPARILEIFGDKLKAKEVAKQCNVPTIPGTEESLETVSEAIELAEKIGYPITLKALAGGGGKGIREVSSPDELKEAFLRSQSEALSSFGKAEIFLEKNIIQPRHIEVQIVGDCAGNILHLYDRDCSVQRRHQKVVEIAPALGLKDETREKIFADAIKIAKSVNYVGVGTVEFLVDKNENHYFLEVNPRIQVEHTVSEMVTGFDIVQASIMLAAGREFSHPSIGVKNQDSIQCKGVAVQCRITTENPLNDFAPDTGKILAYRPAQGFGIRLDEGLGTSGGLVTPYYDSLLVKVTAHSLDLFGAARKMVRALKEFRIRGVKHNIPLLINIISHPKFTNGQITTKFLSETPEVFKFPQSRDRATKILGYLADVSVNDPHGFASPSKPQKKQRYVLPEVSKKTGIGRGAKSVFSEKGVEGLVDWIKSNQRVLLTDTTMRDAHQSLFATRLRSYDIYQASDYYRENCEGLFSLEMWGGATFDTCLRFLKEDPWERLHQVRERVPNILLQMLLRGDNAVGYTSYPPWVVKDFIRLTVESGLDLFRIFDCLNQPERMTIAIQEVKKYGGIAEASICYTGNILDPKKDKYTLKYYLELAKDLEKRGADLLCIKDMAGLLRPLAARKLIKTLKSEVSLPIHLHTHATGGSSEATLLAAIEEKCDIVDGAISSMSGLTSQPNLNAVVASLEGSAIAPHVSLDCLDILGRYWQDVRELYQAFDPGIKACSTEVYHHEIPGGQFSNLFDQARKVGLPASDFYDLTNRYAEVNKLFGDIVKVTPSSKVVGDLALLLQKNKLTADQLLSSTPSLDFPDSVKGFLKGELGLPYGGFPENAKKIILGEITDRSIDEDTGGENDSFLVAKKELTEIWEQEPTDRDVLSYRLYPKVWLAYNDHRVRYGDVDLLPTHEFFYGMEPDSEIEVGLEQGKILYISLVGTSNPDSKGNVRVFFQLNGFPRELNLIDNKFSGDVKRAVKAMKSNRGHVGAPMPGKVLELKVNEGNQVSQGDCLVVTEAMKMEYGVSAKIAGKVKKIHVLPGDQLEEGDLLMEIE